MKNKRNPKNNKRNLTSDPLTDRDRRQKQRTPPDQTVEARKSADSVTSVQRDQTAMPPRIDRQTWLRFIRLAAPKSKYLLGLIGTMIALAILENVSPLMVRFSIDTFIKYETTQGLVFYTLFFLLLVILQSFGTKYFLIFAGRVETDMSYHLREQGFKHLQQLSFGYFDRTPAGWLLARLINDVTRICEVIAWGIVDIVWGGFTVIVILIAMLIMNVELALIASLAIPPVILVTVFFQKKLLILHRKIRQINSEITGGFGEGIMGARTTKTLHREAENEHEFNQTVQRMEEKSINAGLLSSLFMPAVSLIGIVAAALVLTLGGQAYLDRLIELGTLYAFFIYTLRLWDPIRQIARVFRDLQSAQAAAERVITLLAEPVEIADSAEVLTKYGARDGEGHLPWPVMRGDIEFRDVTFWYVEGEPILENFNLKIKAGQTVALVGETGAGKSTLVNLVCRFYEPQQGQILIDGHDIRTLPLNWLYHHLGYVLQTPHLFSGSVADNIRYGNLHATDAELKEAARLVSAHPFIMRLERQYDTFVGESGDRLSTGEKQLISFARAVISDPTLFILDEATSSIDTETEKTIQGAIEAILHNRTAFVVAHRLSTIRHADQILVIREGRIIEQGKHDELIRMRGRYFQLYTGQFTITDHA